MEKGGKVDGVVEQVPGLPHIMSTQKLGTLMKEIKNLKTSDILEWILSLKPKTGNLHALTYNIREA